MSCTAASQGNELKGELTPPLECAEGHVACGPPRRAAGGAAEARRLHGRLVAHFLGSRPRDARLHAGRASRRRRLSLPRRPGAALRVAGPRARLGLAIPARDRAERQASDDSLRELPRGAAHLARRPALSRDTAPSRNGLLARPLGRLDARRRDEDAHGGLRRSRAGQPLSEKLARRRAHVARARTATRCAASSTLYDPENYRRPITRHRSWRREPDLAILEYDCDPYPFFRGLEIEGMLEQYWQRMRQRQASAAKKSNLVSFRSP